MHHGAEQQLAIPCARIQQLDMAQKAEHACMQELEPSMVMLNMDRPAKRHNQHVSISNTKEFQHNMLQFPLEKGGRMV